MILEECSTVVREMVKKDAPKSSRLTAANKSNNKRTTDE